jgi:hypothetical protein
MTDPHLDPLAIEKRAETKYTVLFLTASATTKEYSLHVKLRGAHGLHESETLDLTLEMEGSDKCLLNGLGDCSWKGLGRKETVDAAAIIDATFERFKKHIDRVLETTWDHRCAVRDLGYPHSLDL